MRYADVIIDISHEKVDRSFEYGIPEELSDKLKEGMGVEVPFGRGSTLRTGYVIRIKDSSDLPPEKLKPVCRISESMTDITSDAIRLALWMRENYGSTLIAALRTVLPAKKVVRPVVKRKLLRRMAPEEISALYAENIRKNHGAKARLLKELITEEVLPYELVTGKLHINSSTINALVKEGALSVEERDVYRNPVHLTAKDGERPELSEEQALIVREVGEDIRQDRPGKYLIRGITGSGKTEVYLRLIEETLKKGRQCIMLIPEIALTYQTLMRFYKRFGDRVSVINSTLSDGEKYDQVRRAESGDIDVIIGPRSALFVPFRSLGLVIIDEEHETSYISEQNPRYHARETAEELCRIKGASLVLGSATPSSEAYFKAKHGEYRLYTLTKRLTGGELPDVRIVDMRKELLAGNRSVFSDELADAIRDRLRKKEQIMLFLNRRGYASFISCRACGSVIKCPHCDVSLSRHRDGKLKCHYCGYETPDVKSCPVCGSKYISGFRAGTQQIEEALLKKYPGVRVLRMDADTTAEKSSYERILGEFADGNADILVGTQMIVKGHDFPNVTLVGVIAADLSLNESDFRTGERTFSLLVQAVGRAGRGSKKGEALIQTYRPEHYSIRHAATQDYDSFYEEEMSFRSFCSYPPAGSMIRILITSPEEKRALGLAVAMKKKVPEGLTVIGPAPDPIFRVSDRYRYDMYLKSPDDGLLNRVRDVLEAYLEEAPLQKENVSFIRL